MAQGGAAIAGATAATYTIPAAQASDAWTYDVVVTNAVGGAISPGAALRVNTPVVITRHPAAAAIANLKPLSLSVTATGTAPLSYQWRKDGVSIDGATGAVFTIGSAQVGDAGSYDVEVGNGVGKVVSNAAVVSVNLPVNIITQPVGATLDAGATATLGVSVTGSAPITYQWRRNGAALVGGTSATYTVASLQGADAGSYDVVVTNLAGSVTSTAALLSVNTPPIITKQPAGVTVITGVSTGFSVTATGGAPLAYQWRKEGVAITGGTGPTLSISPVALADAGSYTVVVSNALGSTTSNVAALTLTSGPIITEQPVAVAVNPGKSATFSVAAVGPANAGPITYQWRRNGSAISGATGSTYTIPAVAAAQAGLYDVLAKNGSGSMLSAAVPLLLNVAVSIKTAPAAAFVNPGASTTLNVVATGTEPLTYQWRRATVPVPGATQSSYTITGAQAPNMGSYDVVVSNVVGSRTSTAALVTLNKAVTITTQPASAAVNPGASRTLSVAATGTAPITYQWRLRGVAIPGANASSHRLEGASIQNVGSYDVVLTNVVGTVVSNAATLTLNTPVTILSQPASATVNPGKSVTFSVSATGTGPYTYQWRKNGVDISGATTPSYSVASAKSSDAGLYDVRVTNVVGAVNSNAASLTLNSPVTITRQPAALVLNPWSAGALSVTASGTAPITYQWRKGGVAIPGATASSYALAAVQPGDIGSYDVVVTNVVGSAISATAKISMNAPVTFSTQPASVSLNPGASRTLTVVAAGTAPLSYQWRKNGANIPGATSASYAISAAKTSDAGIYDVAVTNVVGTVSSNAAVVTLNTPVSITTAPKAAVLNPGAVLSLGVAAAGTAPLTYQWRRNGVAIAGATGASYTVAAVAVANAGSYDVVVSNVVGSLVTTPVPVSVNSAVSFGAHPAGGGVNPGASKTLSVAVTGTAPFSYQWRRNGVNISTGTSSSYVIAAATAADAGSYDVVVSNVVGSAVSNSTAVTLNVPVTVLTQPVGAALNPGATRTLTVAASGTTPLSYQWRKNGATIAGATSASYAVGAVQAASAGSYDVVVRNVVGSVTSSAAVISVNAPVLLTSQPTALTVNAGSSATLRVSATGTGPLTYQWRKNGVNVVGATASTFSLPEAQPSDAATYSVVVGNVVGSVTSGNAVLTVNAALTKALYKYIAGNYSWMQARADAEGRGGHLATFTTAAEWSAAATQLGANANRVLWIGAWQGTGAAEPEGGWQWVTGEPFGYSRWGTAQPDDSSATQNYLAINGNGLSTGAWNDLEAGGGGKVEGYILEQDPVQITSQLTAQAVGLGQSLTLNISAIGAGPLSYQWRKNGTAISGATASSYTISGAQVSSAGVYDVVVTNPCGSQTSSSATVGVNVPVSITSQPVGVLANPDVAVQLSVTASGTAPITYQWRKNGAVIDGGTGALLTLPAAQPNDAGSYDVVVTNVLGSVTSRAASVAINTPVTVTSQPQSVALSPGEKAVLSVGVSGTLPVSFQWRQNGVPISGATSATYSVFATQVSGPTAFDVVITNVVGSVVSAAALVSVNVPAAILEQPVALTVNPGADAVFKVVAGGTPPFTYQWRRNGLAIAGATGATYVLPGVQAANAGNFDVVVGNVAGTATSSAAALGVNVPVSLTAQPVGTALNQGASLTLSVTAAGTAPLTYQWFRNGAPVSGATQRTYTIEGAQSLDAGAYHVAVTNVVGTVLSNLALVTFNTPPVIQHQPLGANVNPGAPVSFSVEVSGTAPLSYQWRKNGVPIAGATGALYAIASVQSAAAGSYDVVVTNVAGSSTSDAAALGLNVPLQFGTQPVGFALNPGGTGVLSATVEGTTPVTYQWRRNGTAIEGAKAASYTIASATEADAGSYDLVAGNVVGSVTSDKVQVSLNTPVRIVQQPGSLAANPGAQAVLSVAAVGTAPIAYQWSKDGVRIDGATGERLVLSGVQALDAGSYAVVASNVAGSATSAMATVTVNTPVTITGHPQGAELLPGASLTLSAAASGTAPLSYQWYKNGAALAGATGGSLLIAGARDSDAASYNVLVTNIVGSVASEPAVVSVAAPVSIVLQPAGFTSLVGVTTTLSVTAAGTGPLAYQWRKSGVNLTGKTGASLVLSPVQLSDAGSYDVVVSNAVNSVTSASATLLVQDPPVLGNLLNSMTVKAGTAVSFSMTASGTGPLSYQWRRDGTPIPGANALTYSIPMVDESYAGVYDIVVTGPWGSVVSAPGILTVQSISTGQPVVMTHPVNVTVAWGKTATLSAMVTSRRPFSYEWVRVGEPATVVSSGSSPAGTGLVLTYSVAAAKDVHEGVYELVLRDEYGVVSEVTRPGAIRLNLALGDAGLLVKGWTQDLGYLQADPLATVVLPSMIANNEVLRVGVRTAAAATYSWVHRSGIGTVTRLSNQTSSSLNFKDVVRLRGYYVLTVTSAGVSRNLTFQVLSFASTPGTPTGLVGPSITYAPEALVVPLGGSADFAVSATGSVGGYRWWKQVNGIETEIVSAGSSPWLTIDRTTSGDEAYYRVEVLSAEPGGASVKSSPVFLNVLGPGE